MSVERVLAALDEYFTLKHDMDGEGEEFISEARERASKTLNEYIQTRFDNLLVDERKKTSSITQKVQIPDSSQCKFTWEDVVKLLDALNSPPAPPLGNSPIDFRWVEAYRSWYREKRVKAINSISASGLELDWDEVNGKTDH